MEPNEFQSMWQYYNVHLAWPDQHFEKLCVTALSKNDAFAAHEIQRAISAGAYPYKVIGPLGQKPSTAKQTLAHHYRSCIGAASMVKHNCQTAIKIVFNVKNPESEQQALKITRAHALVLSQCDKLQRDIRDLFKLAGLKIK